MVPFTLMALFSIKCVYGDVHISSKTNFDTFLNNVNSGTNYLGTTVYLDSDLSLTGYTDPIGHNFDYYFRGVFDGQGYVISNLTMKVASYSSTGLFGYSEGMTVKNVILDSSCSVTNSLNGDYDNIVGGIIGYCDANSGKCNIENCVNMGSVTFDGAINYNLYIGGIAGYLDSPSSSAYNCIVKNCANYGPVVHSEASCRWAGIGGIAGFSRGYSSSNYNSIQNCLNYGTITHSGTSEYPTLGGVVGLSHSYTHIENCVNVGKIAMTGTSNSGKKYIGNIAGTAFSDVHINYCYYTNELNNYSICDYSSTPSVINSFMYNSSTFKLVDTVSIGNYTGDSLIDALNAYVDYSILDSYSHWLLNTNRNAVSFNINSRSTSITMNYQILLFPDLAVEGILSFDGWYTDNGFATSFTESEVSSVVTLYGKTGENTNSYTVTFDTRGGTTLPSQTHKYGSTVTLQNGLTRDSCTIPFWATDKGYDVGFSFTMPAHRVALHAVWKCANIKTADDFIDFSKVVNSGSSNYSGETVHLDSDLFLSEYIINPIGYYSDYQFCGVFDGQGYVVSNLTIKYFSQFIGLFGYSEGMTVKNVVLGSSCTMKSTYSSKYAYIGGIIGYCYVNNGQCSIESCVNMGNVTFDGTTTDNIYIGGIAGYLDSSSSLKYSCVVKNCANYGPIVHSGTCGGKWAKIGGIAGFSQGSSSSNYISIHNCLNYGTITHSGTSEHHTIGGVVGFSYSYTHIDNCVSAGKIAMAGTSTSEESYIGSITGYIDDDGIYINYCYYTDNVGISNITGYGTPITSNTSNSSTLVGSGLISDLNAQATVNRWDGWLINADNKDVEFRVNDNAGFSLSSQVILLPDLAETESNVFRGWFADSTYSYFSSPQSVSSMSTTTLYGLYGVVVAVSFNGTGGTPSQGVKYILCGNKYGTLATATRTGYTFNGWFTEGEKGVTDNTIMSTQSNHTLYAHWAANNYTVTFDNNGGDTIDMESKNVTYGNEYGTLAVVTKTGYTFIGWYTEVDGDIQVTDTTKVEITNTQILYAQWIANNYTVTFNATGGNVSIASKNVTYDAIYGDLPDANRTGYTFDGWFTEMNGGTQIIDTTKVAITTSQTLYAHWSVNNYTVTFDKNGGDTIDMDDKKVTYDDEYGTLATVTNIGYTFIGWFTDKKSGTQITNDTNVCIADDHILYAQWTANKYTVTFNATGGSVTLKSKNVTYDNEYNDLPDANRTGYTLDGWFTEVNGGTQVTNTTKVEITTSQTLYAHWTANNYTVTFNATGGNVSAASKNVTYDNEYSDLPDANKTGYTFIGWFTDKETGDEITNDTNVGIADDHTLYAQWTANKYTVTFNATGGSVTLKSKNVTYDSVYGVLPEPTREGYGCNGWYTAVTGGNKITEITIVKITGSQTLYAHWTAGLYTVKFNATGGNSSQESKKVIYGNKYEDLPNANRTGYTFSGWWLNETDEYTEITNDTDVETPGDHTLYAHWTANNYTVTFDKNGGDTIDMESKNVTYDSEYGYLAIVSRTGYTFTGWYTEVNGDIQIIDTTKVEITNPHTLYAHWIIKNYTITFNFDNGTENEVRTFDYNYTVIYPSDPVREGYMFDGWDNSSIKTMPAENLIITAQWRASNYIVTFNANGGSVNIESKNATYRSTYGELPTPTREGYTFTGWFTDKNESIASVTIVNATNDHVLYAQWSKITTQVEIVFETKDLSEKEVRKIIEQYTKADFTVTMIEDSESGETKVIIKFKDAEKAEEFVRSVSTSSKGTENRIKRVGFTSDVFGSFTEKNYPVLFLCILMLVVAF